VKVSVAASVQKGTAKLHIRLAWYFQHLFQ